MTSPRDDSRYALGGCTMRLVAGMLPLAILAGLVVMVRCYGLGWGPRHHVSEPAARLGPTVSRAIAERHEDIADLDDAETGALHVTSSLLHFGFRHRTELHFDRPRQGNSDEYAELFGAVFNELARAGGLSAHAQVVRSEPTSFMGFEPSLPAFRRHAWVVIRDGDDRRYVDPTLHDAWLGADISRNVQGSLERARRRDPAARPSPRPERIQSSLPAPNRPQGAMKVLERLGARLPHL